jgi:Fic family protein
VLSQRRLAKAAFAAEIDDRVDITAEAILGNIRAMELAATKTSEQPTLSVDDIVEIHRTLLQSTTDARWAGQIRTSQNWIGGNNYNPRGAEFVPPPEDDVRPLLADLAEFLERRDLPTVLQAAVAHAQFETIHPFADGNGRVGRCLIHVAVRRALNPRLVPPISLILATDADRYVRGLTEYREGGLEGWCVYFADTTIAATAAARELGVRARELQSEWVERAGNPRRDCAARSLVGLLIGQPVVDVRVAARLLGASEESARRAVNQLERAGILSQLSVGKRNRAWEARDVFELLNSFERELATPPGSDHPARPAP